MSQPLQLKRAQAEQSRKRKIPTGGIESKITKQKIWDRYRDELENAGYTEKNTKQEYIDYLLRDDVNYQAYKDKLYKREKEAALFQKAYARDFNTAVALLQKQNPKIARMKPYTKGGPLKVQYLKYCGTGRKIDYHPETGEWSCKKSSISSQNEGFKYHFGKLTKTSLRERSLSELVKMAEENGIIDGNPYVPYRDPSLDPKQVAAMNAKSRSKKKTELINKIYDVLTSKKANIYNRRLQKENERKQAAKEQRARKAAMKRDM